MQAYIQQELSLDAHCPLVAMPQLAARRTNCQLCMGVTSVPTHPKASPHLRAQHALMSSPLRG
jgi:hypothetical protein